MGIRPKYRKEKRSRNRENVEDQAFTNARAVATRYAAQIFRYFSDLPGVTACDTNLEGGPIRFFAFTDTTPTWFGNTICFDYEGYSFRLYFAFRYNPTDPTVNQRLVRTSWPKQLEPIHIYDHLANYWIQLNVSKTYEPHDGDSSFLIRFDASPDWDRVDLFPHHKHLYRGNVDTDGMPFDGTRDTLLQELTDIIHNEVSIRS